jgi:hypothetical protein
LTSTTLETTVFSRRREMRVNARKHARK